MLALKAKKKKVDEAKLAVLQNLLPLKEVSEGGKKLIFLVTFVKFICYFLVFAHVKNPQLKILNLSMNPFPEADKELCQDFITNLPEDFSLILLHNNFEQKTKEKMRSKFKKTVVI